MQNLISDKAFSLPKLSLTKEVYEAIGFIKQNHADFQLHTNNTSIKLNDEDFNLLMLTNGKFKLYHNGKAEMGIPKGEGKLLIETDNISTDKKDYHILCEGMFIKDIFSDKLSDRFTGKFFDGILYDLEYNNNVKLELRIYKGEFDYIKPNNFCRRYTPKTMHPCQEFNLQYEGFWENGLPDGLMRYYDVTHKGLYYEGQMKGWKANGLGMKYKINGNIEQGVFKDDILIKEIT